MELRPMLALVLFIGGGVSGFREARLEDAHVKSRAAFEAFEGGNRHEPPTARPLKNQEKKTVFELKYKDAIRVDFLREWTLKEFHDKTCSGESKCGASVVPVIDSAKPTESSKAIISVFPDCVERGQLLALCPLNVSSTSESTGQAGEGDLRRALVKVPSRSIFLDLLETVLPARFRKRVIRGMENPKNSKITLKILWVLVLAIMVAGGYVVMSMAWALLRIFLTDRPSPSAPLKEIDPRVKIPSLVSIMSDGLIDAASLIYGCILIQLVVYSFLIKFGRRDSTLLLMFPPIFGPIALLRIFLSMSRRQLYHTLLRHGVLIDFSESASYRYDLLAMLTFLGLLGIIVLMINEAVFLWNKRSQFTEVNLSFVMAQLVLWSSPIYYTIGSIYDSIRLEKDAMGGLSVYSLHESSDADEQSGGEKSTEPSSSHQLAYVSEKEFCAAARTADDLPELVGRLAAGEKLSFPAAVGPFGLMDIFWVTDFVRETMETRRGRILVAVFQPLLWLGIFTLGLSSMGICIQHQCQIPRLEKLEASVGVMVPEFDSDISSYATYIYYRRDAFSVNADINLDKANGLKLTAPSRPAAQHETTTNKNHISGSVPMRGAYPVYLTVNASTADDYSTYWLRVLPVTVVTKTIMLSGRLSDGNNYSRCILGTSLSDHTFSLPKTLSYLDAEVSIAPLVFAMPVNRARLHDFSTVYSDRPVNGCEERCTSNRLCMAWMGAGPDGCQFVMAPEKLTCEELHRKESSNDIARAIVETKVCFHDTSSGNEDQHEKCFPDKFKSNLRDARPGAAARVIKNFSELGRPFSSGSIKWITEGTFNGSTFELEEHKLGLQLDAPKLDLRAEAERLENQNTELPVDVIIKDVGQGQAFQIKLAYNALKIPGNSFNLRLKLVSSDSDFSISLGQPEPPSYAVDLKVPIDKWKPNKRLRGLLTPKHLHLFENRTIDIEIMTKGNITPLQTLVRNNCSVPVCNESFDTCQKRMNASDSIEFVALDASQEMSPEERRAKNLSEPFLQEADPAVELFTKEVLLDIAAYCSLKSGMLSIVQQAVAKHEESVKIRESGRERYLPKHLLQQLSQNPDFKENESWKSNPILTMMLGGPHPKRALTDWAPLEDVVLGSQTLYKLTYVSCRASSKKSITPRIFKMALDRIVQLVDWEKWHTEDLRKARTTLRMLVKCARERSISLYPVEDMERGAISLFDLVSDEDTFEELLPIWDLASPSQQTAGTILHIAAQNGWEGKIRRTLQVWEQTNSTLPHHVDAPREDLVREVYGQPVSGFGHYLAVSDAKASKGKEKDDGVVCVRLTRSNQTALHASAEAKCPSCVEELLKHGANQSAELQYQQATYETCSAENRTTADKLTPIHKVEMSGVTPLHAALFNRCVSCVAILLKRRADPDAAMSMSRKAGDDAVPSVSKASCLLRPLDFAVFACHDCIDLLSEEGAQGAIFSVTDKRLSSDQIRQTLSEKCDTGFYWHLWMSWMKTPSFT